jgi:glucose uptake protein
MFIISQYATAVSFCIITMICWGSWANTQKLAGKSWPFELFYWDYVIGIFLVSLFFALTLGSHGSEGRPFIQDLQQAGGSNLFSAFIGGVIFNAANILVVAAISIAGMAVAFPIGIGLALVLGVLMNYFAENNGNPVMIFSGVILVCLAIIINGVAYKKNTKENKKVSTRGIYFALTGGVLMSFFYRFIAASMDLKDFESPAAGKMTPYTAVFIFSLGILASNFIFNTILIRKPISGIQSSYGNYFRAKFRMHLIGISGGIIWGIGNSLNLIASGKAGPAISYGLGQGATLVAALWGVFVWKEFKNAPLQINIYLLFMFICFISGLGLIVYAGS